MKPTTQARIGVWLFAFTCGYAVYEINTSLVGFLLFGSIAIILDSAMREEY